MDPIRTFYKAIEKAFPGALDQAVRTGKKPNIPEWALRPPEADELVQYSRERSAAALTPPVLLSDYLSYVFEGTDEQFAQQHGTTPARVAAAVYDGCYWHGQELLYPQRIADAPGDGSAELDEYFTARVTFGTGKVQSRALYADYLRYGPQPPLPRLAFIKGVRKALRDREICDVQGAVRAGGRVTSGF